MKARSAPFPLIPSGDGLGIARSACQPPATRGRPPLGDIRLKSNLNARRFEHVAYRSADNLLSKAQRAIARSRSPALARDYGLPATSPGRPGRGLRLRFVRPGLRTEVCVAESKIATVPLPDGGDLTECADLSPRFHV
jgi:hypothetical protein